MSAISNERVDEVWRRLVREATDAGYHVNPDDSFSRNLVLGLLENEERYGYRSCPCRLASGVEEQDRDLVCPCDYRDIDLDEYGSCYCALYVSPEIAQGKKSVTSIPDRRPPGGVPVLQEGEGKTPVIESSLPFPVWRCRVCGYLCARPQPPLVCPVCKASKERFERFL